jgi:hypothetical protein
MTYYAEDAGVEAQRKAGHQCSVQPPEFTSEWNCPQCGQFWVKCYTPDHAGVLRGAWYPEGWF